MLYVFLTRLETLQHMKKLNAPDKVIRKSRCAVKRALDMLHGSDYTAALDLIIEVDRNLDFYL